MKNLSLIVVALFLCVAKVQAQDNNQIIAKTVDYIKEIQEKWKIPGLSFALVKDGEMIYSGAFGVKELGKSEPVDTKTLFQIGSISKSFTATVIASLVGEGKLKWEDSVKNILPDFEMYDKWVEQNLQVRDIMTHHTGLQGQLGTYIPNMGYGRDDIYKMFARLKPTYGFRGAYEYNNITFIIASKIIEIITGKSWEENVKERIFAPLGMDSSILLGEEFDAAKNVVTPHSFEYAKGRPLSDSTWRDSIVVKPMIGEERALHWLSVIGPAGSISSNVEDMSKYLIFHLNKGFINGKQVVTKEQMEYVRKGHTITSQDSARINLYGHCWFVEQNSRYRLYFHTGTTWGSTAIAAFVPEHNLGLVILVNSEAPAYPRYAVMRRVIDLYKGFPDKDYSSLFFDEWIASSVKAQKTKDKKQADRVIEPAPDFNKLVGLYYKDELLGSAKVELEGGKLWITVGPKGWKRELSHINGNAFSFTMDGHTFGLEFKFQGKSQPKPIGLDINFGYTENFGLWSKVA